jgi:HAMP domain-containing protein
VLVKSIQELDAQKSTEIDELKKRIKELEQVVQKLLEIKDK